MGPHRDRWDHALGTVRTRTTLGAVLVVGLALLAGGLSLVLLLRAALLDEVERSTRRRAIEIARSLEVEGSTPARFPGGEEELVQLVDRQGDVVGASDLVSGLPPLAALSPGESRRIQPPIEDDEFLAVAETVDRRDGPLTVIVARAVDDVGESTTVVTQLLVLGLPLLLALVAVTVWRVVGRALAPVEAMRAEVDRISSSDLHRRVPDPAGQDEIARLARTLNHMLGRLEQGQARQRRFISDASHELRSPVASIRQHAEVALAHPDRSTLEDLAGTVLAEDLRVQRLVEDLLVLARADEHDLVLRHQPLDLDDVVFAEAARLREVTALSVRTRAVSAARVDGDPSGLQRVVRNLGENAARHARSTIAFSLAEGPDGVTLTVEDDGTGIAPGDRARVLERFVRLDEARARDGGGSGLGLAIVDEVVIAHGGRVTVGTGDLGGARIEVWLPASSSTS